jgi:hypothetical protein
MEIYAIKGAALLMAEHFCLLQIVCLPFKGTVLYLGTHMLMNVSLLFQLLGEKPEPEIWQRSQQGRQAGRQV